MYPPPDSTLYERIALQMFVTSGHLQRWRPLQKKTGYTNFAQIGRRIDLNFYVGRKVCFDEMIDKSIVYFYLRNEYTVVFGNCPINHS